MVEPTEVGRILFSDPSRIIAQPCPDGEHVGSCRLFSSHQAPARIELDLAKSELPELANRDCIEFEIKIGDSTIVAGGSSVFMCLDLGERHELYRSITTVYQTLLDVLEDHPNMTKEAETLARVFLIQAEISLRRNFSNGNTRTPVQLFDRVTKRLTRKVTESIALASHVSSEGDVLDLACGGTAIMGLLATARGQRAYGIEVYRRSATLAQRISDILGRDVTIMHGDLREAELVGFPNWVSKHPCATERALPDEIIQRWLNEPSAKRLALMPCCPGKARVAMPKEYSTLGMDEELWDSLNRTACLASSATSIRCQEGKAALTALNTTRLAYLLANGASAEIVHAKNTHFGEIICASKN